MEAGGLGVGFAPPSLKLSSSPRFYPSFPSLLPANPVPGAASRHPSIAGTVLQPLLRYAPAALYSLTLFSLYFKLQLPQAVLLHWMAASSFTLGLQLTLRNPRPRAALGFGGPGPAGSGGMWAGGGGGGGAVDPGLEVRVAAAGGADVLVAMAARESAMQRYRAALYCLERAVQVEPGNAG